MARIESADILSPEARQHLEEALLLEEVRKRDPEVAECFENGEDDCSNQRFNILPAGPSAARALGYLRGFPQWLSSIRSSAPATQAAIGSTYSLEAGVMPALGQMASAQNAAFLTRLFQWSAGATAFLGVSFVASETQQEAVRIEPEENGELIIPTDIPGWSEYFENHGEDNQRTLQIFIGENVYAVIVRERQPDGKGGYIDDIVEYIIRYDPLPEDVTDVVIDIGSREILEITPGDIIFEHEEVPEGADAERDEFSFEVDPATPNKTTIKPIK